MYKAIFVAPLGGSEREVIEAHVVLPISLCKSLLQAVEDVVDGDVLEMVLSNQVVNSRGKSLPAKLRWSPSTGGFALMVAGAHAGMILTDELEAATRVSHEFAVVADRCQVSFSVEGLKVWRQGLIDFKTGKVIPLTIQDSLSYLPTQVVISLHKQHVVTYTVEVAPSEVGKPTGLTRQQIMWLQDQIAGPKKRQVERGDTDGFGELQALGDSVKSFLAYDLACRG